MKDWKRKWKLPGLQGFYTVWGFRAEAYGLGVEKSETTIMGYCNGLYRDYYKDQFLHS